MATPKKPYLKRDVGIVLFITLLVVTVFTVYLFESQQIKTANINPFTNSGHSPSSPQAPTPYPSPTVVINEIQVSGTINIASLETQPISIEFLDTATNSGYFASIQNGFYSTSLPNQQTYDVFATWGGSTVNINGVPTSAYGMGTFNLNAGVGITSITKNFSG